MSLYGQFNNIIQRMNSLTTKYKMLSIVLAIGSYPRPILLQKMKKIFHFSEFDTDLYLPLHPPTETSWWPLSSSPPQSMVVPTVCSLLQPTTNKRNVLYDILFHSSLV